MSPRKLLRSAAVGAVVVLLSGFASFNTPQAQAQDATTQVAPVPSAPAGMTLLKTQVVHQTDRLTEFVTQAVPASTTQASRTSSRGTIGQCWQTTATAVYDAPVGRLWSYTSVALWCATRHRVTRFFWEPPDWTITSKGTLAGWHYKGHSTSKHTVGRKLRTGSDVGHFKRYYNVCVLGKCVTTNLGSQDATHHLWVSTGGKHGWS